MNRILIRDIEDLKQKKQQIEDLQKKIYELQEVKLLREMKQQENALNNKIKALSTYESKIIGDVIAKLMSEFEGVLYQCVKNNFWFGDYDYLVETKIDERDFPKIYPHYTLKEINHKDMSGLTFLPPSTFISTSNLNEESKEVNTSYIQYFLDFLYEKRSNNSFYKITKEDLESILQEFLLNTKGLKEKRKKEITKKTEEKVRYKERLQFENSCMINRKLIYKLLVYVINHYEENISATQKYEEEWSRSSQWSELYGYHNLIINDGDNNICFKSLVDHEGCYPDEEYCGVSIDASKDTDICFFDLKNAIAPIIKNYMYVNMLMNMIENLYNESKNVSLDSVHQILVLISNEKRKTVRLKKEI